MLKVPAGWYPRRGEIYWLRLDKDRPAANRRAQSPLWMSVWSRLLQFIIDVLRCESWSRQAMAGWVATPGRSAIRSQPWTSRLLFTLRLAGSRPKACGVLKRAFGVRSNSR